MARYHHLPVFQKCYAFSKQIYQLKLGLPKAIKHDLGSDFFCSTLRCIKLVIFANGLETKEKALKEVILELEVQWVYLRLLHDLKALSSGQFKELSSRLSEIGAQASAWLAWEKKQKREREK